METEHKIIFGDCLEKLKQIPNESVDLVFADPPYNMSKEKGLEWKFSKHITMQEAWDIFSKDEFFEFNLKWLSECFRVLNMVVAYGYLVLSIIYINLVLSFKIYQI